MGANGCKGCRERDQRIAQLEARVQELEAKLAHVLGRNSKNSSQPPSTNPPNTPKNTKKKTSGRKRGGQPGHAAQVRERLPLQLVNKIKDFLPETCAQCQQPLAAEPGPDDPPPLWHQYVELPKILVHVTEYRGHARTCSCCGQVTQATIPADLRAHGFGPRFTGVVSALTGVYQCSKRDAESLVETVFGVPIALGTVVGLEQEDS